MQLLPTALFVKPYSASAYETYSRESASSSGGVVAELSEASPLFNLAEAAPGAEIYFGNGCFWGRQHEFVEAERRQGRALGHPIQMSCIAVCFIAVHAV